MMGREEKLAMYDAFFSELGEIEKAAMMNKVAWAPNWAAVQGAGKAVSNLGKSIAGGFKGWQGLGVRGGLSQMGQTMSRAAKNQTGALGKARAALFGVPGGVKGVTAPGLLQTELGRAGAATAAGAAGLGAAGLGGAALIAGRRRQPPPQQQ